MAVNALGNVRSADGAWIAGCRDGEGRVMDPRGVRRPRAAGGRACEQEADPAAGPCANTHRRRADERASDEGAGDEGFFDRPRRLRARHQARAHFRRRRHRVHVRIRRGEADYDTFAILATEAMQGAVVRAVEQAEAWLPPPATSSC